MENREFYASTIEEAVQNAAIELGLPSEDVSYRVLDEGNTGFLGIGARDARITVEASPENAAVTESEPLETSTAESDVVDVPEPEPSKMPQLQILPRSPKSMGSPLSPNRCLPLMSCSKR